MTIGGIVGDDGVRYGIEIPNGLSLLVAFDPNAEVTGLDRIPKNDRPPVPVVHLSFDTMVGSASLLLLIAALWTLAAIRKRTPNRLLLLGIAISGPLSVLAMEAGWFVTEFGRQPWIARGLLRTTDAVTIAPGLDVQFYVFTCIYVVLGSACWWLLRRVGTKPAGGERKKLAASGTAR